MGGLIAFVSVIIRNFFLPNPFEPLGEGIVIKGILLSPIILNWIFEGIIHVVTFTEVGIFYSKGEAPGFGSFLYLIFYIFNVGVLWIASWLGLHWYSNLLVLAVYIGLFIFVVRSVDR